MAELDLNVVGDYLIGQIKEIMIGGDKDVPVDPNKFISWCLPGIPFTEDDFDFSAVGLGTTNDAEQYKKQLQHAYNFAMAVDFIPDITQVYNSDKQERIYSSSQARLSEMYKQILNLSKVVNRGISDDDKKKIEKYRGLLMTTKKVKNLVTDEETEVTVDGPVMQAYNDKMLAFINASIEYNAKRAAAQSAPPGPDGMPAVADFANNAQLYRLKVRAANDAWTQSGYKNEVDQMHAFIDQVTRRNMMLWKRMLIDNQEKAQQAALGAGLDFYYTSPIPGGFAKSSGWLKKTFKRSHFESQASSSSEHIGGSSGSSAHSSNYEAESSSHREAESSSHKEAESSSQREAGSSSSSKQAGVGGRYGLFSGGASYSSSSKSAHSSASDSASSSAGSAASSAAGSAASSVAGRSSDRSYSSNLSEKSIMSGDAKLSDIEISFEITQVLISRPWFYPEFFMNRGWILSKGDGWLLDMPSDGKIPEPKGTFIAYPTSAIFVRNVKIKSQEIANAYESYKERQASLSSGSKSSSDREGESSSARKSESGSAQASESSSAQASESSSSSKGGKVRANYGIGCFSIGGSYGASSSREHSSGSSDAHSSGSSEAHSSGSSEAHISGHSDEHSSSSSSSKASIRTGAQWESTVKGDTIEIPGMQIIAFICQFFGKAPNPDPELKDTDFS